MNYLPQHPLYVEGVRGSMIIAITINKLIVKAILVAILLSHFVTAPLA